NLQQVVPNFVGDELANGQPNATNGKFHTILRTMGDRGFESCLGRLRCPHKWRRQLAWRPRSLCACSPGLGRSQATIKDSPECTGSSSCGEAVTPFSAKPTPSKRNRGNSVRLRPKGLSDRLDHVVNILIRELCRQRQTHRLLSDADAVRIVFRLPTESLRVVRLYGNAPIVHTDPDVLGGQSAHE